MKTNNPKNTGHSMWMLPKRRCTGGTQAPKQVLNILVIKEIQIRYRPTNLAEVKKTHSTTCW